MVTLGSHDLNKNKSHNTIQEEELHFQDLMLLRVHEILLVASPYDSFILEEEGQLTEQILQEYIGMSLNYAPRVSRSSTAKSAFNKLEKNTQKHLFSYWPLMNLKSNNYLYILIK